MGYTSLVPEPEALPAPWQFFEILDVSLFALHILLINIVVGGSILALFRRSLNKTNGTPESTDDAVSGKLPGILALGISLGIAPLLFIQVVYGQFFYSSSVLMASWWIIIIPSLILGYYGLYLHRAGQRRRPRLSKAALLISTALFLYIGFMFTNNMTLMVQPEKWTAYFDRRGGTFLNISDATILPRYLHFVIASIALGGLFTAIVWRFRLKYKLADNISRARAERMIFSGLKVFGWATIVQILAGAWLLISLPGEIRRIFMGGDLTATILLTVGILLAIGAVRDAFRGRLSLTAGHLIALVFVMATIRAVVRAAYLGAQFNGSEMVLESQYSMMFVFLIILIIGLLAIWSMLKPVLKIETSGGGK